MDVNYCGNCGAAARSQVKFCRQCGNEITVETESAPSQQRSTEQITPRNTVTAVAARPTRSENGHVEAPAVTPPLEPVTPPLEEAPTATPEAITAKQAVEPADQRGPAKPQARSSALAQASGLEGTSAFGSRMRALLIGLAVLIVGVASGVYYRQSLRAFRIDRPERNLVTPEEQSLDFIKVGKQSIELGQYEKAITQFKEALVLTPEHESIYLLLAQSYQASGQVDEAMKAYWTLLRRDPGNLEARLEVAEIHRARGNWREAYQEYQRIININSQSLEAIAALAVIEAHDEPGGVPVRVVIPKHHTIARLKMPVFAPSLPRTGGAAPLAPQRVQGSALTAPPALLSADDDRGDARALAESHKALGSRYHNVREYLAAIREFSIAQRLNPGDKDLYYLLGSCFDGLDQDALAHSYYKQCDSGDYAGVARSGAQRTLKAAQVESKKQEANRGTDVLPSRPTGHSLK